jgi:serine/threonine protein kinase/WD40 repeat protein
MIDPVKPSDDRESAAVFEFVDDYAADLEAGRTRTLAEYLARHRGFDAAIAREYLRLRGEDHAHATPHAAPDSAPVAEADERRIGHYRMIRELGRGGQGSVWLAEDVRFARKVALKVLASRFESVSEDRRARFRREAEVIARLEHPGICPIYDADIDCDTPWIAMRLVEGQTLAQLLTDARAAVSEGRTFAQLGADAPDSELTTSWPPHSTLDVHRTLLLFERAARALHAAHEAGVIHRDFKPGNVIVTPDGKPVVLDFGLAREVGTESAQLTESGEIFGTPAYMSPEQLRGASDELDRRTDVYSLGVALYESLTLVRPFETQNNRAALFAAIQFEPAADPRALNAALTLDVKVVLDTALEKDRARRYATALELAEDLRRIREYEPIRARPAGMVLRFGRWTRRHPALAGALGVLVVSFVVTVALLARVLVVSRDRDDKAVKMLAALDVALGKHLAQRAESLTQEDPSAALVLGIRAVEQAPGDLTRAALFSALDAAHLAMLFDPDRAGIVKDLALSHDETRLALACSDGTVQVFDARTGTMLFALGGPSASAAVRIAWSADDTVLAAGHGSGDLVCWDVDARRETGRAELGAPLDALVQAGARFACRTSAGATFTIDSHAASARPLADTPVDGLALAASGDGVLVWRSADAELELHAGDALFTCRAGARLVAAACARASEGWRFFAGTSAGNVEFLDEDGTLSAWWSLPAGAAIESVSASADGAFVCVIAGSASQRDVIVLDATARERFRVALDAGARPRCAAFSPRDGLLAVSASDRTLHIVDPRGRDGREYQQRTLSTGFYLADEIEWSRDARMLFTRPNGPYAHAWYVFGAPDLPVAPHARALDAHVSADGGALVWATARGTIESAPLAAIAELAPRACEAAGTSAPLALPVSAPDGESWACARADEDGARWTIVRYAADARPAAAWSAAWPVAPQTRAFLAPGGRALATISAEGRVHLAHESAPEHDLGDALASTAFASAAFDEHGARVALGARDGRVLVLDSVSGAQLAELVDARARGAIAVLAFRPGGDELAAFGDDTFVRSWNIADGTRVRGDEQLFPPRSLAYSRDGGLLLATGSAGGGAVRVFALAPFAASKLKTHHKQDVTAAEFSADGRFLLSAARDGSVFVRESRTGELFARRTFEGGAVIQAHFDGARENPRVVSVMQDGSVRVWPIDPLPAARARFQRGLDAWEIQREQMLALPLEFR